MSDLAGVYGRDTLLSQVVRRLRHQECGSKAVSVVLIHPIGLRKPVMVRVALKGLKRRIEGSHWQDRRGVEILARVDGAPCPVLQTP